MIAMMEQEHYYFHKVAREPIEQKYSVWRNNEGVGTFLRDTFYNYT